MKSKSAVLSVFLMAFAFLGLAKLAYSASGVVSPKENFVLTYTTVVSTVTPTVSTNAVTTAAFQPGAVYEIVQSTGASGDYFQMYDSTGAFLLAGCSNTAPQGGTLLGGRIFFSSATQNTVTRFDPPLVFHNGLIVCQSAAGDQTTIVYELGRGLSGQ